MKALNISLAILGGAIVGASLGLLFAPEKGKTTRTNIANYLRSKGLSLKKGKIEEIADDIATEIEEKA